MDAAQRCRELFDLEALLKALASEFGGVASAGSPPKLFCDWAACKMTEQSRHAVFADSSCTCVALSDPLAVAVLEALFLGQPQAPAEDMHQGVMITDLFDLPKAS